MQMLKVNGIMKLDKYHKPRMNKGITSLYLTYRDDICFSCIDSTNFQRCRYSFIVSNLYLYLHASSLYIFNLVRYQFNAAPPFGITCMQARNHHILISWAINRKGAFELSIITNTMEERLFYFTTFHYDQFATSSNQIRFQSFESSPRKDFIPNREDNAPKFAVLGAGVAVTT